jgi:hypothetical protein
MQGVCAQPPDLPTCRLPKRYRTGCKMSTATNQTYAATAQIVPTGSSPLTSSMTAAPAAPQPTQAHNHDAIMIMHTQHDDRAGGKSTLANLGVH